jgi:hypothetical protein
MPIIGLAWAIMICIPFWLIVIMLVKIEVVSLSTIVLVAIAFLGLPFLLLRDSNKEAEIKFPYYEIRNISELDWQKVSEIRAMKILVDYFDPVNPALSDLLLGKEIVVSNKVLRLSSPSISACI